MPIATDPNEEFQFWGRQIVEHALFSHLALEEPTLKAAARQTYEQLGAAYQAKNLQEFVRLTNEFIATKQQLVARIQAGEWLGWAYPSFLQHMVEEEQFFLAKLQGPIPDAVELNFWLHERRTEAEVTAHLIDPSAKAAVASMMATAKGFNDLENAAQIIPTAPHFMPQIVQEAAQQGAAANAALALMKPPAQPLSIIAPDLAMHVHREGERMGAAMAALLGQVAPAQPQLRRPMGPGFAYGYGQQVRAPFAVNRRMRG